MVDGQDNFVLRVLMSISYKELSSLTKLDYLINYLSCFPLFLASHIFLSNG